jgi:SlyX protein
VAISIPSFFDRAEDTDTGVSKVSCGDGKSVEQVTDMDDTRLDAIETKLSFQEDALQQLHEALVAQQTRIDQLEAMLEMLAEQQGAGDDPTRSLEPPPPHY